MASAIAPHVRSSEPVSTTTWSSSTAPLACWAIAGGDSSTTVVGNPSMSWMRRVDAAQRPAPDAVLTVDDPQRREQERHESVAADGEAERSPLLPVAPDRQPLDPPLA